MNGEVRALFWTNKAAFRSGDKEAYKTTTARLKAAINEEKMRHQQRLERDHNTNSSKDLWQAIQNVTGYKSRSTCDATLPEELNTVYAHSDFFNKDSAVMFMLPSDDQ